MKRTVAVLLAVLLLVLMLPAALAADTVAVLAGVDMKPGDYLHNGATAVSASAPSSGTGYAHLSSDGKTLTLNGFDNEGKTKRIAGYDTALHLYASVTLNMENSSTLTKTGSFTRGIGLQSGVDLTIEGTGTLNVHSNNAIEGKTSDLTINGGTLNVNGDNFAIQVENLKLTDGMLDVVATTAGKNRRGIRVENDATFSGGKVKIVSGETALYAMNKVSFSGAIVDVESHANNAVSCKEISITDGIIDMTSTRNPLWASDKIECTLTKEDGVEIMVSPVDITDPYIMDWVVYVRENDVRRTVHLPVPRTTPTPNPTATPSPTPTAVPDATPPAQETPKPEELPATGDGSHIALWLCAVAVSMLCMATMRKKSAKE